MPFANAETKPWILATLKGHTDPVYQVRFAPDDKWLVTAAFDNTLRIWDAGSGKPKRTLEGHTRNVFAVDISKDGKQIASGSDDNTIKLWDANPSSDAKAKKPATAYSANLTGHRGGILGIAFHPEGKILASCSSDKSIRLWDIAGKKLLRSLPTQAEAVYSVAFSPDGRQLATAGADKTVRLFDTASGTQVRQFTGPKYAVYSVAFAPNGKQLAGGGMGVGGKRSIYLWNVDKAEPTRTIAAHKDDIYRVEFNGKGNRLASIGYAGHVKVLDVANGKPLAEFKLDSILYHGSLSPAGHRVAVASNDGNAYLLEIPKPARG